MADLRQLCTALGIDADQARAALQRESQALTSALAMPWYVRLVVGVGAWATAIAAIALGVAAVFLAAGQRPWILLMFFGVAYFVAGLFLLRRIESSLFASQLAVAVAAAGTAMIVLSIMIEWSEVWAAFLVSLGLTAAIIGMTPNRALQFLATLLTVVMFTVTVVSEDIPYFLAVVAVPGAAAVGLMLWPTQRDMRPAAVVLLLVFPIFDSVVGDIRLLGLSDPELPTGGQVARALNIAVFLGLAGVHWQRAAQTDVRTRLIIFSVAAVVVGLLLPPGGAAALAILMLAFVVGSRPLALLGTLIQINYIWRFYYFMEVTLLVKSGILVAVGAVLVFAWWLMMRHAPEGARS